MPFTTHTYFLLHVSAEGTYSQHRHSEHPLISQHLLLHLHSAHDVRYLRAHTFSSFKVWFMTIYTNKPRHLTCLWIRCSLVLIPCLSLSVWRIPGRFWANDYLVCPKYRLIDMSDGVTGTCILCILLIVCEGRGLFCSWPWSVNKTIRKNLFEATLRLYFSLRFPFSVGKFFFHYIKVRMG